MSEQNDLIPNKRFFRVDEVADIFGVTSKTVYRWIDEERLIAQRTPGNQIRILRENLQQFVKNTPQHPK